LSTGKGAEKRLSIAQKESSSVPQLSSPFRVISVSYDIDGDQSPNYKSGINGLAKRNQRAKAITINGNDSMSPAKINMLKRSCGRISGCRAIPSRAFAVISPHPIADPSPAAPRIRPIETAVAAMIIVAGSTIRPPYLGDNI
tara:strand:- start:4984 stop:5409 length:426 start_codon:yes stop_codon:yes gene_type:complete